MAFHDDLLLKVFYNKLPFEPQHTVVKDEVVTPVDGFTNHTWLLETQDSQWVAVHAIFAGDGLLNVDYCKTSNIFRAAQFFRIDFTPEPYKTFWLDYYGQVIAKIKEYHKEIEH